MFVNDPRDFDFLEIGLASPDKIRYWSYGEVEKPETINYRTFKPERKGLFCEKIFGPVKDWECSCGKYRRIRYRGIVCERCGVEVTHSKVRRERMGHLELAAPVTHIWFLKGIPSYLGIILDISSRQLEEVIYYDSYIVTSVDESLEATLTKNQLLSTVEYIELKEKYPNKFTAEIGAAAIKTLLGEINLSQLTKQLRKELETSKGQKKLKVIKRLRVIESLYHSGNSLTWLVLDVIPVMPPDLRPMVQLEGGRFATSDLNDLYRRVVNRNNRLKRLMDIGAPEMIIRNEKRMLQESVDVLISNGKRGRAVTGSNGRPLKSLGNIIEGKQGRFRQNLLGKRVDYSARSVIVVGPHLKFHECGLPKDMALELFKPFVIRKLVEDGIASNVKSAKRKIEKKELVVWSILEKVIKGKLVLLNRAPTLHRLGIQAFQPNLVEGSAIQVHPLVCTAFNADFDGDQMAVHLPLSIEAQTECKLLIESTNNILSPSSGKAIATPTQDMVLGLYYLTVDNPTKEYENKIYANEDEAKRAFETECISFHSKIKVKIDNKIILTTIGRIIFNEAINNELVKFDCEPMPFINYVFGKKQIGDLVYHCYITYGNKITASIINSLKKIGFKYSTLSGLSISIEDLTIPNNKPQIIQSALKEIENLNDLFEKGVLTAQDKKERSSEVWRTATQKVSDSLQQTMGELNNVFIMANSGARGNMDQVRQLAGMRGLMSDSQGRTIEIPIKSNFKEGLTLTEYFISAYGARKGLVDTALRTADSGYLTRRLVDVSQDIMISIEDCGTTEGIRYTPMMSGIKVVIPLSEIVYGRISLEDIKHPETNKSFIKKGDLISKSQAKLLDDLKIESILTRSAYKCKAERGVCQKCYGVDLSTSKIINVGEAAGIIAAQSIGEPGTQLTMRTFHTGGVDLRKASTEQILSTADGKVEFPKDLHIVNVKTHEESFWILKQESSIVIKSKSTESKVDLPKGCKLFIKDKSNILKGDLIAEYDPNDSYVISVQDGISIYDTSKVQEVKKGDQSILSTISSGQIIIYDKNSKDEIHLSKTNADKFKKLELVNQDQINSDKLKSSGVILDIKTNPNSTKKSNEFIIEVAKATVFPFNAGSQVYVKNNAKVSENDCILYSRATSNSDKTQDIVQGLPKVEELFEARKPKDSAILSELDGTVDVVEHELYWSVIVFTEDNITKEYKLPKTASLIVFSGQEIKKGDPINQGQINPHDLAKTKGIDITRKYLSDEIQKVYASQGVQINKKHVEIIVRQMTMKVTISDMGDSTLLLNEMVDIRTLNKINNQLENDNKNKALSEPVLLGITRASLNTESFVSASSFQQTASVLTKAAIEGQKDSMKGLKENVIIGSKIPAGTGVFDAESILFLFKDEEDNTSDSIEEIDLANVKLDN